MTTKTNKTTAATPRAEWVRDESVGAWCLQAPAGYRLGDDLHEFVYDFDAWRGRSREAKRDAFARLDAEGGVQPCTARHCDWCNGANAAHVVEPCRDPRCWCRGEIPGASRGGMTP